MRIELADCTQTLLDEIGDTSFGRNDVALTYAMALCSREATDWKAVNAAIIARWSLSALTYIKERAHKWVEEKRREAARDA
jgi:hypothetical protein